MRASWTWVTCGLGESTTTQKGTVQSQGLRGGACGLGIAIPCQCAQAMQLPEMCFSMSSARNRCSCGAVGVILPGS